MIPGDPDNELDPVVVDRACSGFHPGLPLTTAEFHEAIRILNGRRLSDAAIAARVGRPCPTVHYIRRSTLGLPSVRPNDRRDRDRTEYDEETAA